ncbi:MAG TPA: glutathione S-transferase family protein [Steroidobacteraceae bacterium]|jgi:glutathione S-transferase
MSDIIVHGIPGSPYVRIPLLACEEKGVSYRLVPLGLGESKSAAHLARHPFGRVPAIEHGEFKLYEAAAIVRYIDQVFDGPSLTPVAAQAQGRMNQVMNIVDWYVMPSISTGIGFNRVVRPLFGMPVVEAEVTAALPLARTCIETLSDFLGNNSYFGGLGVSLADLTAFAHLDIFALCAEGEAMMSGTPLPKWLARMNGRESAKNTTWDRLRNEQIAA